jgi:hypothetical protein
MSTTSTSERRLRHLRSRLKIGNKGSISITQRQTKTAKQPLKQSRATIVLPNIPLRRKIPPNLPLSQPFRRRTLFFQSASLIPHCHIVPLLLHIHTSRPLLLYSPLPRLHTPFLPIHRPSVLLHTERTPCDRVSAGKTSRFLEVSWRYRAGRYSCRQGKTCGMRIHCLRRVVWDMLRRLRGLWCCAVADVIFVDVGV